MGAYGSGDALLRKPITGMPCCARAAGGHAAAPPSSVMHSRLFIDRISSDPPRRECMTEYRVWQGPVNLTHEKIIFFREVSPVSIWTEDDKRIATRALKTLEEASVASRGAAIYYLETVLRLGTLPNSTV